MDEVTRLTKEAFEPKLGRPMTDEEAAEYALHMRRFAAFLLDCARDDQLMERLGFKREGEGRADPRAVDNTTQNGQEPQERPISIERIPPTAPPRDTSHRDSSAYVSQSDDSQDLPVSRLRPSPETVTVQTR